MENEINENINEVISLRSKCYSIQKISDNNEVIKSKGISKHYCKKFHTHKYFQKILFIKINMKKAQYYKISLKDGKLITHLQVKDDISNFIDKRYMIDNLTSNPHTINL